MQTHSERILSQQNIPVSSRNQPALGLYKQVQECINTSEEMGVQTQCPTSSQTQACDHYAQIGYLTSEEATQVISTDFGGVEIILQD